MKLLDDVEIKTRATQMPSNSYEFYLDGTYIYIYSAVSVASCTVSSPFSFIGNSTNVFCDNLNIVGFGVNGITLNGGDNTIRNCEIHKIGGSPFPTSTSTRYGNGIEMSSGICHIHNNNIHDRWDAGITPQNY